MFQTAQFAAINEAVDDGVYDADEVFERRRPARQRKRPSTELN